MGAKQRSSEEQIHEAERKRLKTPISLGRPRRKLCTLRKSEKEMKECSWAQLCKAAKKPGKKCRQGQLFKVENSANAEKESEEKCSERQLRKAENSMTCDDDEIQEIFYLPDSLIIEIVLRIPQPQVWKFRAVCKHWNSFITNHEWHKINNLVRPVSRFPALLFRGPRQVVNTDERDWIQTCYFSKSGNSGWESKTLSRPTCIPALPFGEELQLMASEGGLLFFACCHAKTTHFTNLLVCNPLLVQSKRLHLPSPATNKSTHFCAMLCLFGVEVNPQTSSFKIIVAGLDPGCRNRNVPTLWSCFLYNSIETSWKCCALPPSRIDTDFVGGRCVFCRGSFYWLARPTNTIAWLPIYVVRYDIGNDIWEHIETDFRKRNTAPCIVSHQDQLFLCSMGEMKFHYRRLGLELDVPYLDYESLDRVIPSQVRTMSRLEEDEDLFHPMSLCFSYGEFCIQVGPDLKTDSMIYLWTRRECPRFKVTMQSTVEDTHVELNWATEGTQFLERDPDRVFGRDPDRVFGFSPSLTMLP